MIELFLCSLLTSFSLLSAAGFGYIYHKDKDKRKLKFVLALAFASINYLSEMRLWDSTETLKGVLRWRVLPIISAVSIAVVSSLLKLKNFDKAFKIFLFTMGASIIIIITQLPANPLQSVLFQTMAFIIIIGLTYLYQTRKELPDLMFLLSILCFTLGGCNRFVESHNGSIRVESEGGKGSIFTVVLPMHRGMEV